MSKLKKIDKREIDKALILQSPKLLIFDIIDDVKIYFFQSSFISLRLS